MACWVVPSVAAEYWNVSVERVWDRVQDGSVDVRHENGFTFIDVAPSPAAEAFPPQRPDRREPPPATFVEVAREAEEEGAVALLESVEGDEMESATLPTGDLATVRLWVSQTRRAPRAA